MDFFLRFFTSVILFTFTCVRYVKLACFFYERSESVPPVTNELLKCSATLLADKIRKKQISSYELVLAYVTRIKEVNPIINAVAEERFTEALEEARNVDIFLSENSFTEDELKEMKPLLGIPVTIKENLSVKGLSSTLCSMSKSGQKALEDGDAVKKFKDAGAIIMLVSTTPEYCICMETYTKLFGITRNPYNTLRVAGGSSGGEGALLGAGASVIGLGSDLAGSIRYPSAFNGIFGHKPTHGYISLKGHNPISEDNTFLSCLTLGPMTRYAEDLTLVMNVIGERLTRLKLDEPVDLSTLKIYYMDNIGKNFGVKTVQSEIKAAIKECALHLQNKCNSDLSKVTFPNLGYAPEIVGAVSATMQFASPFKESGHSVFGQLILEMFGCSKYSSYVIVHEIVDGFTKLTPKRKIKQYIEKMDLLKEEMSVYLAENGVFLFPAFPTTALRHKEFMHGYGGVMYSFIVNILGFPSTTVPIGKDNAGLPIGIQVIANINQDRLCIAVAKELESAFGGWLPPS